MSVEYRVESRNFKTGELQAILPYSNLQGEWKLNDIGEVRFTLPLYHRAVRRDTIFPIRDEIWIWRKKDNEPDRLVFAGPLMTLSLSSSDKKMSLTAQDLLAHLKMRVLDTFYTDAGAAPGVIINGDPEDIAWLLIFRSQEIANGDMRFVRGKRSGASSKTSYAWQTSDYKTIYDAVTDDVQKIQRIANPNGLVNIASTPSGTISVASSVAFDFDFDPLTRAWNTYYPKGIDRSDEIVFQYKANVQNYWNQVYGSTIGTKVIMTGAGDPPDYTDYENVIASDQFGLREKVVTWRDSPSRDALFGACRYNTALLAAPHEVPGLTLQGRDFDPWSEDYAGIGDIVRVRIDDGWTQIDQRQRIVGFQLTLGSEDNESFNVYMNDLREVIGDANATS